MTGARLLFLLAVLVGTGFAAKGGWARAPESSLRPVMREEAPQTRTEPLRLPSASVAGPVRSLRPQARPSGPRATTRAERRTVMRGAVCGDPGIQGSEVGRVPGKQAGCGIENAVRVRSVAGVALSQEALLDCPTAQALKQWVTKGMRPAMRGRGEVVELRVAAHYACRTRNNRPGARISEHGRGRAIDISGLRLSNGQVISVLNGWNDRRTRQALRQMHKAACGPFGTVLGPDADRFHRDHFHFDTARYRSGPYCR